MRADHVRDRYLGSRRKFTAATLKEYARNLDHFLGYMYAQLGPDAEIEAITEDLTETYFAALPASWSESTYYMRQVVVHRYFEFARVTLKQIAHSPTERMERVRRPNPEDLDVVTVNEGQVGRMVAACEALDEYLVMVVLIYTGVRSSAAANVRWRDVDFENETATFREKGGKVIVKPLPHQLADALYAIALSGDVPNAPDDYLIPNRLRGRDNFDGPREEIRYYSNASPKRGSDLIYRHVRRVGARAGVRCRPHALRAAFAVKYLEFRPGDLDALQFLLGHARPETTRVYLRRQDRFAAMERARGLDWGSAFGRKKDELPISAKRVFSPSQGEDPIAQKLAELSADLKARQGRAAGDRQR